MGESKKTRPLHCNRCQRETKHDILANHKYTRSDGDSGIDTYYEYFILQCRGCEAVSMLEETLCSEDVTQIDVGPDGEPIYDEPIRQMTYPPRLARTIPKWISAIEDEEIEGIVREVYSALQNDSRRLAVVGIRIILERVMIKAVGDKGTFVENLKAFVAANHLSKEMSETMSALLDAGHASTHRGFNADADLLTHVVDTVEQLMWQIYVMPTKVKAILSATPKKVRPA
jgi:hypothetical protein